MPGILVYVIEFNATKTLSSQQKNELITVVCQARSNSLAKWNSFDYNFRLFWIMYDRNLNKLSSTITIAIELIFTNLNS